MLLETCRYKIVDGKLITKMFGMKGGEWDIDEGWCHDKKAAKAAAANPKVTLLSFEAELVDNTTVKASRFARKLAEELNLDVNMITGTGIDGAITKDDVTNHYNSLES